MIFIVLPIFNEAKSLAKLLEKIKIEMEKNNFKYKILAINDGSADETSSILESFKKKMPLIILAHKFNRGLGESVRDGFEKIAEISHPDDIIIRMDGDDTHEPSYIKQMIEKINNGFDVVIASRFAKGASQIGVPIFREILSKGANILLKICFPIRGVSDYACGFRAYRASLIKDAILIYKNDFIELKGLGFTGTVEKLIKLRQFKIRIAEIPFKLHYYRKSGESKMSVRITSIGYLILIIKNIYPWGQKVKKFRREIKSLIINRQSKNK